MFPRQKICLLIAISIFLPSMITAQFRSSGIFENHSDIGNVKKTGSVSYNSENQEYTISGAGANMWEGEDQFHYLWTSIQGDFIVRARMEFTEEEGLEVWNEIRNAEELSDFALELISGGSSSEETNSETGK